MHSHRCFGSVNLPELAKVPANKLRSYLITVLARELGTIRIAGACNLLYDDDNIVAPPAQYVPCFSRTSERDYSVTRCVALFSFPCTRPFGSRSVPHVST